MHQSADLLARCRSALDGFSEAVYDSLGLLLTQSLTRADVYEEPGRKTMPNGLDTFTGACGAPVEASIGVMVLWPTLLT